MRGEGWPSGEGVREGLLCKLEDIKDKLLHLDPIVLVWLDSKTGRGEEGRRRGGEEEGGRGKGRRRGGRGKEGEGRGGGGGQREGRRGEGSPLNSSTASSH